MDQKGYENPDLLMTPRQVHGRLHDGAMRIVDVRPTHEYTHRGIFRARCTLTSTESV